MLRIWPGTTKSRRSSGWSYGKDDHSFDTSSLELDLQLVRVAHKQYPSLCHVSFIFEVDWKLEIHQSIQLWMPLRKRPRLRVIKEWLHQQSALNPHMSTYYRAGGPTELTYSDYSDDSDDGGDWFDPSADSD